MFKRVLLSFILSQLLIITHAIPAFDDTVNDTTDRLMFHAPRIYFDCQRCDIDYIKLHVNSYIKSTK